MTSSPGFSSAKPNISNPTATFATLAGAQTFIALAIKKAFYFKVAKVEF
jgi:hypothetical protein